MSPARVLWLIFGVALGLRVAYAVAMYLLAGPDGLLSEDSGLYLSLGEIFVRHGDFVRPTLDSVVPETERMPLYVIWLALHRALSGASDPLFPALTQGALDGLACLLIARIAGLFDRRLMLPAGLIAACNPTQIVVSALILNDSLFFLFCCLALYAALDWLRAPNWRAAIVLGGALGLGVSTRTMLLPWTALLALLLPFLALIVGGIGARLADAARRFGWNVAHMTLVVLLCLVVQAPIFARNLGLYGSIYLTSQGGTHSLLWIAPLVREAVDGTSHEQGAREYEARFIARYPTPSENPFEQSRQRDALAREVLGELGAGAIAKAWAIGAAINLFSPAALVSPPMRALPRTSFFGAPGETKLDKIRNFLFANASPTYAWIMVLTGIVAIALRLVEVFGLGLAARARRAASARLWRTSLAVLILWAGYVLLINGPIASAKYRLPIEPLAALGLAVVIRALLDRRAERGAPAAHAPSGSR